MEWRTYAVHFSNGNRIKPTPMARFGFMEQYVEQYGLGTIHQIVFLRSDPVYPYAVRTLSLMREGSFLKVVFYYYYDTRGRRIESPREHHWFDYQALKRQLCKEVWKYIKVDWSM